MVCKQGVSSSFVEAGQFSEPRCAAASIDETIISKSSGSVGSRRDDAATGESTRDASEQSALDHESFTGHMIAQTIVEAHVEACGSCRYWKLEAKAGAGQCHRHAPQSIVFKVDEKLQMESRFPETASDDWCGDYQRA